MGIDNSIYVGWAIKVSRRFTYEEMEKLFPNEEWIQPFCEGKNKCDYLIPNKNSDAGFHFYVNDCPLFTAVHKDTPGVEFHEVLSKVMELDPEADVAFGIVSWWS